MLKPLRLFDSDSHTSAATKHKKSANDLKHYTYWPRDTQFKALPPSSVLSTPKSALVPCQGYERVYTQTSSNCIYIIRIDFEISKTFNVSAEKMCFFPEPEAASFLFKCRASQLGDERYIWFKSNENNMWQDVLRRNEFAMQCKHLHTKSRRAGTSAELQ